jgi:hypothetical protein
MIFVFFDLFMIATKWRDGDKNCLMGLPKHWKMKL